MFRKGSTQLKALIFYYKVKDISWLFIQSLTDGSDISLTQNNQRNCVVLPQALLCFTCDLAQTQFQRL